MKVGGAPISWGVCEVPGWGYQMPAERVIAEMASLGLAAAEFGPDAFLAPPLLERYGIRPIGGYVPLVLHDPARDPLPDALRTAEAFRRAGADVLVLAAETGLDGYEERPVLDAHGWRTLLTNLNRISETVDILTTLHPHVGTMIEAKDEVERVLDGSGIALCLDTGHLFIGGTDPGALAEAVPDRIKHVHLKDVDERLAQRLDHGYGDAVRAGLYRPLGQGAIDLARVLRALRTYEGWYVLEQDVMLAAAPPAGAGPLDDVRASLDHLRKLAAV